MEATVRQGTLGARWSWGAALLLAAAVVFLVAPTLGRVHFDPEADEGYYLRFTQALVTDGLSAFPRLAQQWLADEPSHLFPPPSRFGFLVTSQLWARVFGVSFESLARLSLACTAALVLVQFAFARRHFGDAAALLIALLSAASPLGLGLSRRALTDANITLLQTTCLWLFLEVLRRPRSLLWQASFVAVFAWTVATKEIALLLALPMAVFALVERRRGRDVPLVRIALVLAVPPFLAGLGWIAVCGGLERTRALMDIVLRSPATNVYAILYGSGPWYRYLVDPLLVSPWSTALGLAGIALTLLRWRRGEYEGARVFLALVYVLQIAALSPFTKNVRYVMVLETPLRASAVLLLWLHFDLARSLRARLLATILVAALAARDVADFRAVFVERSLYDPVSAELLQWRHLLPWRE